MKVIKVMGFKCGLQRDDLVMVSPQALINFVGCKDMLGLWHAKFKCGMPQ